MGEKPEISAEFIKGIRGTDDILIDGVTQITFLGRSNVGKSSLVNSITGRKNLVKVGKKPGKTTEINFFLANKSFYLVDLPGYGFAEGGQEAREKIRKLILWYFMYSGARPNLLVLIVDIKVGVSPLDKEMIRVLRDQGHPFIVVANKSDKLNQRETSKQLKDIREETLMEEVFPCSAQTGSGVVALRKKILESI